MIEFGENNVDAVVDSLERFVDSFDFHKLIDDRSLGRDIAMTVVNGIIGRNEQKRGAAITWKDNEDDYAKWKDKKYGVEDAPNVRTGDMLSQRALHGRTTIESEMITMIYGTGDKPTGTTTGMPLPVYQKGKRKGEQIDDKTDIEKAYFAHTGQSKHKIKRPFYELDEEISAEVESRIAEALNDYIAEENRKRGL